jgi:hypothetical protein
MPLRRRITVCDRSPFSSTQNPVQIHHKRERAKIKNKRLRSFLHIGGSKIQNAFTRCAIPCHATQKESVLLRSVLFAEAVGLGLAAVCPAAFVALLHAGTESNVDAWRSGEAEGLGYLDEVKAVDVENAAQAVRCVGLEV